MQKEYKEIKFNQNLHFTLGIFTLEIFGILFSRA